MPEPILEPDLPIIDPHHHLWDLRPLLAHFPEPDHPFIAAIKLSPYYTFDELHSEVTTGHNVIGTVYMECGAFYDADRDPAFKTVGEVAFVNGVAAQGAFVLVFPDGVLEDGDVGDAVEFGDADVVGELADGTGGDTAAT